MSEKIKNYVGIAIIVGILLLGVSAASYVTSYSKVAEPPGLRSFSVTGEGKVVAVPDVAKFTLSVITEGGKTLTSLQKENTEKVNKIIEFVKAKGVEAKDIKTQYYNVEPRYQYFTCQPTFEILPGGERKPCPPPEITGYTINQTVSVKVRDFDKTGELLGGVVDQGANSVSQLSFTVDDPYELRNQARAEAIAKARAQALATAKAGGFILGRLLSIDEGGYPYPYYADGFGGGGASALKASPPPTIEPGSQEIVVNLILRYEIE